MEAHILVSREVIEGYIVETYVVDDNVGFNVVISADGDETTDSEDITLPVCN